MINNNGIKKLTLSKGDPFKVRRKTRPDIEGENGHTYSKDAFNLAMDEYMKRDGRLYLAPVVVNASDSISVDTVKKINCEVYGKFHYPHPNIAYTFATIIGWNDYDFICKYNPTEITEKYASFIDNGNTQALLRYIASDSTDTKNNAMIITGIDIPVIPFGDLGIDIDDYLKDKNVNTIRLIDKYN